MEFILLPIAIYVAAALQTSLMPAFALRHATPDLLRCWPWFGCC